MFFIDFFFFQAEDGIRDYKVTGVQTCALPIYDLSARRNAYACADRSNFSISDDNCAVVDRSAREREDLRVGDGVGARRWSLSRCRRNETKEVHEAKKAKESARRANPLHCAPPVEDTRAGGFGFSSGFFSSGFFASGFFSSGFCPMGTVASGFFSADFFSLSM